MGLRRVTTAYFVSLARNFFPTEFVGESRGSQDLLPTARPTPNRIVSFNRCQDLFFDCHAPLPKRVSLNRRIRTCQLRQIFEFLAGLRVFLAQGLEFTMLSNQYP